MLWCISTMELFKIVNCLIIADNHPFSSVFTPLPGTTYNLITSSWPHALHTAQAGARVLRFPPNSQQMLICCLWHVAATLTRWEQNPKYAKRYWILGCKKGIHLNDVNANMLTCSLLSGFWFSLNIERVSLSLSKYFSNLFRLQFCLVSPPLESGQTRVMFRFNKNPRAV